MKKVIIIHGWSGNPQEGWIPALKEAIGIPDEQTYLVGYSMGCQAIARYLEELDENIKIGGAVFVAGFFRSLSGIDDDKDKKISDEWLKTPINLDQVKIHLQKSVAIFSDNDPYVPLENTEEFENILKSKIIIEHGKEHFSGRTGTFELPSARDAILEMAA